MKPSPSAIVATIACIFAVAISLLWAIDRGKAPVQVVREVPKEIVKEVPKELVRYVTNTVLQEVPVEVIKEVPARLSFEQALHQTIGSNYASAATLGNAHFTGIAALHVTLDANESITTHITTSELQDTFELSLRRNNVPLNTNPKTPAWVIVSFHGLWTDDNNMLCYTASASLSEPTVLCRTNGFWQTSATSWRNSYTGFAGKLKVRDGLTGAAERLAESVANAYLKANLKN